MISRITPPAFELASAMHRAKAAEQNVGDGAVHGLAHQDGEDEAGEAVQRAGDDEHVVAEHEAGGGRRQGRHSSSTAT